MGCEVEEKGEIGMNKGALVVMTLRSAALVASLLPLQACAYWGGPLAGRVLEEGTRKPIACAIVVARWQGTAFSFVDTHTVCMQVETAVADGQGRYHIPFWRKSPEPAGVRNLEPDIVAYKASYE